MRGLRRGRLLVSSMMGLTVMAGSSGLAYAAPAETPSPSVSSSPMSSSTPPASAEPTPSVSATPEATPTPSVAGRAPVAAADSKITVSLKPLNVPSQPSGSPFTYQLSYGCSNVDSFLCADNPVVTIPLPSTVVSSNVSVVADPRVGGWSVDAEHNLVVTLTDLNAGDAGSFQIVYTPPNGTTPNATSWTLTPALTTSDGHPPVVGNTVTSSATAKAEATPVKKSDSTYYELGSTVTYTISPNCRNLGVGMLDADHVVLSDTLPAGLTLVSATVAHPGVSVETTGNALTVTYPSTALPSTCAASTPYANDFAVVVKAHVDADADTSGSVVRNTVTETVYPIAGAAPVSATSQAGIFPVTRINTLGSFQKMGFGPLLYTAGEWYYANGMFHTGVFPGPGQESKWDNRTGFTQASQAASYADPLPCLDNVSPVGPSAHQYTSNAPGVVCANPAWTVTKVTLSSSVPVVTLLLTEGTWVDVPTGGATTLDIPAAYVGRVSEVRAGSPTAPLAAVGEVVGNAFYTQMTLSGYASDKVTADDVLKDFTAETVYMDGQPIGEATDHSELYVSPQSNMDSHIQIDSNQSPPAGSTYLYATAEGQVSGPLTSDIVVDVSVPGATDIDARFDGGNLQLTDSTGASVSVRSTSVSKLFDPATNSWVLRYTWSRDALSAAAPNPNLGFTFNVTMFPTVTNAVASSLTATAVVSMPGQANLPVDTNPAGTCRGDSTPTRTVTGDFGCASTVNFNTLANPSAAAIGISKAVKGSADTVFKGTPVIGTTVPGSPGEYRLNWTNQTADTVGDVVLYDILPFVGDTGTLPSTAGTQRGSQFAVSFDSMGVVPTTSTVFYSTSSNPCRPELGVAIGCDDTWTSTVPADPSSVRALKVVDSGRYSGGDGFAVTFKVDTPVFADNQVAWNTFAQASTDVSSSQPLTPTETSKVGLTTSTFAHLDISKVRVSNSGDNPNLRPGDPVKYQVKATNTGAAALTHVVVSDLLPPSLRFDLASGGGTLNGDTVSWPAITFAPGQTVVFTVDATVQDGVADGSTIVNRAQATSDQTPGTPTPETVCQDDPTQACASTPVTAQAPLELHKSVDKAAAFPGDTIVYTLKLTNPDRTHAANIAEVYDTWPQGLTVTDIAIGSDFPKFVVSQNDVQYRNIGLSSTPDVTEIAPNTTLTLATITATVDDTVAPGTQLVNVSYGYTSDNVTPPDGTCAGLVAPDPYDPRYNVAENGTSCAVTTVSPLPTVTVNKFGTNCDVFSAVCPLPGSTFELYDTDPASGASPLPGALTVSPTDGSVFTSVPLKSGRFWLVETKAPSGHQLLAQPVEFTLSTDGIALAHDGAAASVAGTDRLTLNVLDPGSGDLPTVGAAGVSTLALWGTAAGLLGSLGLLRRNRRRA